MTPQFPQETGWWNALLFRLSGPDNAPVRALIAGNPYLPQAAFEQLAQDSDLEVLEALAANAALPGDMATTLILHPESSEFLSSHWYDTASATIKGLTSDDLLHIMDGAGGDGMEAAILHQNANDSIVEGYLDLMGGIDYPELIAKLLIRFPYDDHPQIWRLISREERCTNALLACATTPSALLMPVADDLLRQMDRDDGWNYLHEVTEELFQHPNVTDEIFDLLMGHHIFQEQDYDYGLICLTLISAHPKATDEQRTEAEKSILTANEWGTREGED